jgi:enoyl-CoA hydratase/carnithine racemase
MNPSVLVEDHDHERGRIRIVRMNRPDARHAMNAAMLTELLDALDAVDATVELTGLLLTGDDDAFSAGADVREQDVDGGVRRMELFTVFYEVLSNLPLPTAAAVEGPAIGGGAEAAAACDIRVAGRSARFRFPGAIYGIPVGPARLVGLVGLGTAKDWILSARDVGADEAASVGFVQRVLEDGAAEAAAWDWLVQVGSRDPDTVRLQKRMLNDFEGVRDRVAWENDALRAHAETGGVPPGLDRDLPRTVRPRRTR